MSEVHYFWDEIEDNVVREYDENNNTLASYTTEPTRYGSVLSQNRSGETRYFQFDGQGNTTELTDEAGNVTDTRRYTAFGETAVSSGATATPCQFGGPWGYHTSGDGPISIRRRKYESSRMRWSSADPLGVAALGGASLYTFVANSPLANADPSGLLCRLFVQCWRAWYGRHCGFAYRYVNNASLVTFYAIDAKEDSLGFGTVAFYEKWDTADATVLYDRNKIEITHISDSTCECLSSSLRLWNALNLPYRTLSHNSNYALKCLAKRCGVSVPAYGQSWGFDSKYKCLKWGELIPAVPDPQGVSFDSCPCEEWQECPTGFDEWGSGLAILESGSR